MLKRLILATPLVLATLLVPATSHASTIPYDCAKCGSHNTSFDVTYSLISAAENTYEMTITADYQPDGAGTVDYTYINALAILVYDVTYQNGTPSVQSGPDGDSWSILTGGLNASGCSGAGAGFFCINSGGTGAVHTGAGDSDTWVILLDLAAPLGDTQKIHFKGHFVNASGQKVGDLISDDFFANAAGGPGCGDGPCVPVAAVPEPASLMLMGAGLSLIALRLRKRA